VNIEDYRQRLLALERQLAERIGREVEIGRDTKDDQPDVSDQSVVGELRDESFTEADTDAAVLKEVRAALGRIEAGTYGRCRVDDQPIEEKRLEAVPWTPYCLKHQQQLEPATRIPTL
jgi:DnaK suppressor protein